MRSAAGLSVARNPVARISTSAPRNTPSAVTTPSARDPRDRVGDQIDRIHGQGRVVIVGQQHALAAQQVIRRESPAQFRVGDLPIPVRGGPGRDELQDPGRVTEGERIGVPAGQDQLPFEPLRPGHPAERQSLGTREFPISAGHDPRRGALDRRPDDLPTRRSAARTGLPMRRCRSPPPAGRRGRNRGASWPSGKRCRRTARYPGWPGSLGSDSPPNAVTRKSAVKRSAAWCAPSTDRRRIPTEPTAVRSRTGADRVFRTGRPCPAGTAGSRVAASRCGTSSGSARRRTSTAGTAHRRRRPGRCCPARSRRPRCPVR